MHAGFSAAPREQLYIAQDLSADRPTAAAQMEDLDSQYHQIKHLIALRQAHQALANRADIAFVSDGAPGQVLAYERICEEEKLLIVLNPCREAAAFTYSQTLGDAVYTFGGAAVQVDGTVTAGAVSAGIYRIK